MDTSDVGERGAAHRSVWSTATLLPSYPPLQADTSADVCVIGAGIAGLSVAYHLARAHKSVLVIDDGPVAGGVTGLSTAHLSCAIDDRYFRLERWHGPVGARLAADSHRAAIESIAATVERERIECGFEHVDGYLVLAPGDDDALLARELEAATRAGVAVERVVRAPWPDFDSGPALRFRDQAQLDPLRYAAGIADAIRSRGGRIHCGTHADRIAGDVPARVTCGAYQVSCLAIVVATNTPVNDRVEIHTKQPGYLTYALAARLGAARVPRALYWDTGDPYHYVRIARLRGPDAQSTEFLIVGGEDHRAGQADDAGARHARLESWARERFSGLGAVEFAWAGEVMEPVDGLAYIGTNPLDADNVFIATGDSGMGITHGAIAGMLLSDLILGRRNRYATLYEPSRKTLRAAGTYVRENLDTLAQYGDWLAPSDVDDVAAIAPDSGAVLRRGLARVAVYRGPRGALHERSAVCPHLGCVVSWNDLDKTWDCPCHGSRFDRFGKVVHGPANRNLGAPPKRPDAT